MFNWLKMHFIPHEGNGHRPHILHKKNVHRIIGFVIFVEVFAFLIPTIALITNADTGNVVPAVLSVLINKERAQYNLPALTVNEKLNESAQAKADDMAANGYFAHTSPDGKTPWHWLQQVGYSYKYAGENLAINFTDANDVTTAWMNSPTHRANILKANYTEVGTGVASGMYQGTPTIFVAQDFGSPAATSADTAVPTTAPIEETPVRVSTEQHAKSAITGKAPQGSSAQILGSETSPAPAPDPVATQAVTPQPASQVVAPTLHQTPSLFQRMLASPRSTTNIILGIILGIVILAVFLNIGIKISHHHPDLILNGVMAVAIIGCVFVINGYIRHSNPVSTTSVDFAADNTAL